MLGDWIFENSNIFMYNSNTFFFLLLLLPIEELDDEDVRFPFICIHSDEATTTEQQAKKRQKKNMTAAASSDDT